MIRIIIVDDCVMRRTILEQKIKSEGDFEIADSLSSGKQVLESARINRPDIVICASLNNSEINCFEVAGIISDRIKIPVLLLIDNSLCGIKARESGACDYLVNLNADEYTGCSSKSLNDLNTEFFVNLFLKIRKYAVHTDFGIVNKSCCKSKDIYKVLCIGASTGGPSAVADVLSGLGNNFPLPVLYVQHIEEGTESTMIQWFNSVCKNIKVRIAEDGIEALPGTVYMSPGDKHLVIEKVKSNCHPILKLSDELPERFLKPAVNKLFRSASSFYGKNCLAVLLTGMGRDGAEGCKEIVDKGGYTIVEDKSTCAIFGMPGAAISLKGASEVLPRNKIAERILSLLV